MCQLCTVAAQLCQPPPLRLGHTGNRAYTTAYATLPHAEAAAGRHRRLHHLLLMLPAFTVHCREQVPQYYGHHPQHRGRRTDPIAKAEDPLPQTITMVTTAVVVPFTRGAKSGHPGVGSGHPGTNAAQADAIATSTPWRKRRTGERRASLPPPCAGCASAGATRSPSPMPPN